MTVSFLWFIYSNSIQAGDSLQVTVLQHGGEDSGDELSGVWEELGIASGAGLSEKGFSSTAISGDGVHGIYR